jgi:RHS repeat-associated protein
VAQEANGATWKQTYLYDRYGNRTFDAANTTSGYISSTLTINPANNRYNTGQGQILYDAAGNLTKDFSGHTSAYDAESHQVTYDGGATIAGGASYSYDGDGRRVKKVTGGVTLKTTVFIYNVMGQLVAEYDDFGQQGGGGTSYLTSDTLGTPRVITDSSGGVKARHDYLPFGEELGLTGGRTSQQGYVEDDVRQKFTQKERDTESGLDYFIHRYFSSAQGRFVSPDIPFAGQYVDNPQSWNLYGYNHNNPLNSIDPDGRSTHTTVDGVVLAVYNDGDLGVYIHTEAWDGRGILATSGKGVRRVGETEYWDEFAAINEKTGAVIYDSRGNPVVARDPDGNVAIIMFGKHFDEDVNNLAGEARDGDLEETLQLERHGRRYDIKTNKQIAPYGYYTGKLLNGKYVSARSAGNYLAGMNAALGKVFTPVGTADRGAVVWGWHHISEDQFMRLAGAYQVLGEKMGTWDKIQAYFGTEYGPKPYYGELPYSGRWISAGFKAGEACR